MLYYELKKIWVRPGTKIAMLILAVMLALTCYFAIHDVYYVNENGENEYGLEAIHKLKAAKKEWTGWLTEEVIANVIAENIRFNETEKGRSAEVRDSNIVFGWKQSFHDIRWMLMYAFCKFREADYYKPDFLVPEDAQFFYENRMMRLKEWLEEENQQYLFNEKERAFLIRRYAALEEQAPFYYDYADGWKQLFTWASMIVMLMMLTLSFIVANIFSGEFGYKADSVFYASYYGRGKAVAAKVGAGFLSVTIVYFITMTLYSAVMLGIFGVDGAELVIQTNRGGWKSFYLLTNWQQYVLTILGGYVGTLFILLLTMLVSARTKSQVLAVTIPFILLFLPSFIDGGSSDIVGKIMGLLPDRLLDVNQTLSLFYLYEIGGKVLGSLHILPVLYGTLSAILIPTIYHVYRKLSAG